MALKAPENTYVRVGSHIRTCRSTHTVAKVHTYVRVLFWLGMGTFSVFLDKEFCMGRYINSVIGVVFLVRNH